MFLLVFLIPFSFAFVWLNHFIILLYLFSSEIELVMLAEKRTRIQVWYIRIQFQVVEVLKFQVVLLMWLVNICTGGLQLAHSYLHVSQ